MLDLWYKNAVIYCVDVDAYMDSNGDGDGVGDFRGLADRLDHIESLGANCIWLLPFFPSPNRDNGYDISNYYAVDERLGSLGNFVAFTCAARDHGLRVLIDLVVNHTSTDHPWFQSARSDPNSPYRDWYIGKRLLTYHNLGDTDVEIETGIAGGATPLISGTHAAGATGKDGKATLPPYGYLWLGPQEAKR